MGLIVAKLHVKTHFLSQWTKYVPAILSYAEKSTKKNVLSQLTDIDEAGQYTLYLYYV